MKEKIREILVKHSDNKQANDRIEAELLDLFSVSERKYPDECIECGADEDYLQPYDDELFICERCRITLPYIL